MMIYGDLEIIAKWFRAPGSQTTSEAQSSSTTARKALGLPDLPPGTIPEKHSMLNPTSKAALAARGNTSLDAIFARVGAMTGIDPALLKAVAMDESSLNPRQTNGNAWGLFQLMPAARKETGLSAIDALDPMQNSIAGAKYLKKMLADAHGDLGQALEKYHGGPNKSAYDDADSAYAAKVLGIYHGLQYNGGEIPIVIKDQRGNELGRASIPPGSFTVAPPAGGAPIGAH